MTEKTKATGKLGTIAKQSMKSLMATRAAVTKVIEGDS